MATSPAAAARPVEKDPLNLSPKEFSSKLDELGKHHNNIMKLAAKVYSLGKTQRLQYPNGQTVGRKELRTLSSQYVKELKSLRRNYTAHGKKKKRARREGGSAGFKNPILVTDNMRAFFQGASLGPSDPRNPASAPLSGVLAVGQTLVRETSRGTHIPSCCYRLTAPASAPRCACRVCNPDKSPLRPSSCVLRQTCASPG